MVPGGSTNLLLAAVLVNGAVAVAKLVAAAITGSGAILAEFIHSIALTTSLALVLVALRRGAGGQRQRSSSELAFWCLVVPILIYSLAAGVALNESMAWLQSPRALADLPTGLAILTAALGAQAVLALVIRHHGPPPHREDAALLQMVSVTSIAGATGVGATLAGLASAYAFGTVESDAFAALTVGLVLGAVAAVMATATRRLFRSIDRDAVRAAGVSPQADATGKPSHLPLAHHKRRKR